jgi:hypothetical protein
MPFAVRRLLVFAGPLLLCAGEQRGAGPARGAETHAAARAPVKPVGLPEPEYAIVRLSSRDMQRMKAKEGDLLYVADARRWLGGLRSSHCRAGQPHDQGNVVLMAAEAFKAGNFRPSRRVRVEKFF